jgi:hypothetical protein
MQWRLGWILLCCFLLSTDAQQQCQQGPEGIPGPRGVTGSIGPVGPPSICINGTDGATGTKGDSITGARGDTGATGPSGDRGPTGPVGPMLGIIVNSLFDYTNLTVVAEAAVARGDDRVFWLVFHDQRSDIDSNEYSLPAENLTSRIIFWSKYESVDPSHWHVFDDEFTAIPGPTGAQGAIGPTGASIVGPTGPVGATGAQGPIGPQGDSGANGTSTMGATGATGPAGPTLSSTAFVYSLVLSGPWDFPQGPYNITFVKTGQQVTLAVPFIVFDANQTTVSDIVSNTLTADPSLFPSVTAYESTVVATLNTCYDEGDVPDASFPLTWYDITFSGGNSFAMFIYTNTFSGSFSGSGMLAPQSLTLTYITDA